MFKPTRSELREVQRLATECEIDAKATARLLSQGHSHWYGMHRPAIHSRNAFDLSKRVTKRCERTLATGQV